MSKDLQPAYLVLEDGAVYQGVAPAWQTGSYSGEVVFTTGMTGYFESLTDPSYKGQHLIFTYPLIGNYGVPEPQYWESDRIQTAGVIMSDACLNWSHFLGKRSLLEWFASERVPVITGVDTRDLTKRIRNRGAMLGVISDTRETAGGITDPNLLNLVAQVSIPLPQIRGRGRKKVVAIDCGIKTNILRCLEKYDTVVHQVPHDYNFLNDEFDGIFISNGPGNPETCTETIRLLQQAMKLKKPIFGICLGSQLLSLAAGARTYKLPFGHRGHNQPCIDLQTGKCYMTSQNHGWAIDEKSLPAEWKASFRNLNDGTVEGIRHKSLPYYAVQFHPEAAPGPTDTDWIFEEFIKAL